MRQGGEERLAKNEGMLGYSLAKPFGGKHTQKLHDQSAETRTDVVCWRVVWTVDKKILLRFNWSCCHSGPFVRVFSVHDIV